MAYETIIVDHESGVGTITLNRPDALNALNTQLINELSEALDTFEGDDTIGCIVILGSNKAFAAGADIKEMSEKAAADFYLDDFFSPWTSEIVKKTRKPWIAAVNGSSIMI